jgi:hypothetical protein
MACIYMEFSNVGTSEYWQDGLLCFFSGEKKVRQTSTLNLLVTSMKYLLKIFMIVFMDAYGMYVHVIFEFWYI